MNYTLTSFIIAFLLTNAIELLPLHFLIKRPLNLEVKALLVANSITLPLVWLLMPIFFDIYLTGLLLIEVCIIIGEAYILKIFLKENLKSTFIASLAMNVLSATIGLFL